MSRPSSATHATTTPPTLEDVISNYKTILSEYRDTNIELRRARYKSEKAKQGAITIASDSANGKLRDAGTTLLSIGRSTLAHSIQGAVQVINKFEAECEALRTHSKGAELDEKLRAILSSKTEETLTPIATDRNVISAILTKLYSTNIAKGTNPPLLRSPEHFASTTSPVIRPLTGSGGRIDAFRLDDVETTVRAAGGSGASSSSGIKR